MIRPQHIDKRNLNRCIVKARVDTVLIAGHNDVLDCFGSLLSTIYGSLLPLCYLQFTVPDYHFAIFKPLLQTINMLAGIIRSRKLKIAKW
jgi:hypothetical protein